MAVERHLRSLEAAVDGPMTLGTLVARMHGEGTSVLIVFLCLPFLQPIPMGGLSTVIGPLITLLGVRIARGGDNHSLPAWIASRRLEEKMIRAFLAAARWFFGLAEKVARPRLRALSGGGVATGLGVALSGALLALPFPIPLSNMICAGPAALLCLGALEEDGLLALIGWLGLSLSVAFHIGLVLLGAEGLRALFK